MHIELELRQKTGSAHLHAVVGRDAAEQIQRVDEVKLGLTPVDVGVSEADQGYRLTLALRDGRVSIPGRRCALHLIARDGRVMLGPVIAIFTSSHQNNPRRRFASLSGRFKRFVLHARDMGALAYVFTPRGVNWRRRTITGFTWIGTTKTGRWVKGTFPFPNVVYNRVPTRKAERRPRVDHVRRRLLAYQGMHLFNPEFLDKWQVYQLLRDVAEVHEHLPETRPYRRISDLIPFLERHRNVYLKLASGSLGNGTARIDVLGNGRYRWRSTRKGGQITARTLWGHAALGQRLRQHGRGRTYLMQQGIDLLRANGRPFDVRALVQKEPDGTWSITGMAARIAGPRQITTHRPRGGSRARLSPLIRSVFGDPQRARQVEEELARVIAKTAEAFDAQTGRRHGELSMDVAIDQEGRPWILELNAKPAIFDEPSIRKDARQRLLNYCFSVGGFPLTALS